MLLNEYCKVEGILPTPSYMQKLTSSFSEDEIIIIYEIEHDLKTPYQHQWLSDIKIIWQRNIIVKYEYIHEFYINEYTIANGAKYSLLELSKVFKSDFIRYPKPYYPPTAKELYKRLAWYANKLNKKELLTIEILYATAKRMNSKLDDKYQERELFKKTLQAYYFIKENQVIKTKKEVQQVRKQNGVKRGMQITKEFRERVSKIKELIPLHVKPNGKPNVTAIARELEVRRETVSRILKIISITLLIFWIKSSLSFYKLSIQSEECTIIPSASITLFSKYHKKGVSKGYVFAKV